jgi:hypothetical protein
MVSGGLEVHGSWARVQVRSVSCFCIKLLGTCYLQEMNLVKKALITLELKGTSLMFYDMMGLEIFF